MLKELRHHIIIFNLCFFALACAISMNLFIKGYPEKVFYLVSYVAVTYTVIQIYKNPSLLYANKSLTLLCISLILFSASKLIWAELFKNTAFIDIRNNYHTVGKRFLLAAFMIFYFYQSRMLINKNVLKLSIVVLCIGLIIALCLGYISRTEIERRVTWTTDAATTAAYVVILISMLTIILIQKCFKSSTLSLLLIISIFLITTAMVLLTETRAAIFLTPVLYLFFFLTYYRGVAKKTQAFLAIIVLSGTITTLYYSWGRVSEIKMDITAYQTNNNTSLGARFSMWKSGWHTSQFNFLGQSTDKRYQEAEKYVRQYERGNPEATRSITYHLHNDMLETLSLQGLFGLCALLFFYFSSLYFSLKKGIDNHSNTFFVIFPVITFGITDVVLIQSNTAMVIIISLALSIPLLKREN